MHTQDKALLDTSTRGTSARATEGDTETTEGRTEPQTEGHPTTGEERAGREGRGAYLEMLAAHKTHAQNTKPDHGRGHAQE